MKMVNLLELTTVPLYPQGYTLLISLLLEFESTPRPLVQPEVYVKEGVH